MKNMFTDTVTLYNRYKKDGVENWRRTVLSGVYFDIIKGAVARKTGVTSADSALLIIPMKLPCVADFAEPAAYSGTGWTLKSGDYIAIGEIAHDISSSPKELREFCETFVITAVDIKNHGGNMAHWEVNAK